MRRDVAEVRTYWAIVIAGMVLLVLAGSVAALTAVVAAYIGCAVALERRRPFEHQGKRDV
jgi:hypothetical protein